MRARERGSEEVCRLEEHRQALGTSQVSTESEAVGGGWMSFSEPGSWTNQACGLGLSGSVSDAELDRLVAFYAERGAEPKVEVATYADPSLFAGLSARGFQARELEHVMALDLVPGEDLRAALDRGWPDGLAVEVVDPKDDEAVDAYVRTTTGGFFAEGEEVPAPLYEACRRVAVHPRVTSLLARANGEVAAGGGLDVLGDIGCLIGASTNAPFRRRGVHLALCAARAERARDAGCRSVCVHGRPGSHTERNARRLGFELAYAKVVMAMPGKGLAPSP